MLEAIFGHNFLEMTQLSILEDEARVTDPVVAIVKTWFEKDKSKPRKQRHTKTRVFERLRDEYQFVGSRRAISDLVSKLQDKPAEVFCPIDHPIGEEVQIDWGEATVVLAGLTTKVMIYCVRAALIAKLRLCVLI